MLKTHPKLMSKISFSFGLFFAILLSFSAFANTNNEKKPVAENFIGTALDGTRIELSELRGKVVVVSFWTTRCPICAAEIPKLNKLTEGFVGKDVVFLGLTTDNEDKVKKYLKKKPFDFTILPNSFGTLLAYADKDRDGHVTMGYPSHFLINQNGEIELKTSGFDKTALLDKNINRLLKIN